MPRVIHFEIPAEDPVRAVEFYQKVFDWKIQKWEGPVDYWLVKTGQEDEPGIDGAIKERVENEGTHNTIDVPFIDEFVQKIEEAGGKVLMPKTEIPGIGYHAYCQDTEGNIFGLMEPLNE
jgi:predicted enzyme related to lactoylglutathione lyase